MGLSDIPPSHSHSQTSFPQQHLIPLSFLLLSLGVLLWDLTYIFTFLRCRQTKTHSIPLTSLAVNISWEIVYALYVSETALERFGFATWLLLDLPVVWVTLRWYEGKEKKKGDRGLVLGKIEVWFAIMVAVSCWGHLAFMRMWLAGSPGFGLGEDKRGKFWRGREGYDTTELAFWSAGFAQCLGSVQSLALLIRRGHSGGTGYGIWISRFLGSICGMELCNGLLWWYWPEAHGYFVSPLSIFMCTLAVACDVAYGVVLWHVRKTEKTLPDGRIVRGDYYDDNNEDEDYQRRQTAAAVDKGKQKQKRGNNNNNNNNKKDS